MIRFACPSCNTSYSAAEQHAGKRTTCKQCGAKFLIPGAEDPPYEVDPSSSAPPTIPQPEPVRSMPAPTPVPELPPPDLTVPVELAPCPQCQAKMSVRPEDVGFDLQCPFCQTVFLGVAATVAPVLPPTAPAPAPTPEAEGVQIAPCPKCRAELTVDPVDLGGEVECPFCQTVYTAEKPKPKPKPSIARPSTVPPPPPKGKRVTDVEGDTSPIKLSRDDDDDDDDDDDYRPRKTKKKRKRLKNSRRDPYEPYDERLLMTEPSNGVACLMMGLAAFFCCAIIAFWTIPQCNETIEKVNSGQMDASAKPLAIAGLVLSYIAIGLWILTVLGGCLIGAFGR